MTELAVALLNFATRFGIDAAILFARRINRPGATLDDAIAALDAAARKSAEDYLKEAAEGKTATEK